MSHSLSLYEHDVTVVDGHKVYVLVQLSNWKILKELLETKLRLSSRDDPKILQTQLYDHPLVKDEYGNNALVKIPSKVWKNYIAINDEIEREVRFELEEEERQAKADTIKREQLALFEGAWCPLFGELPLLNLPRGTKNNPKKKCLDIIVQCRKIWGIDSPSLVGCRFRWPSPKEVSGLCSEMELLYARHIYRSASGICLNATNYDGSYIDEDGVARPKKDLVNSIERAISWARYYASPLMAFGDRSDLEKEFRKKTPSASKILAILAIDYAVYAFECFNEGDKEQGLSFCADAEKLCYEANRLIAETEKEKIKRERDDSFELLEKNERNKELLIHATAARRDTRHGEVANDVLLHEYIAILGLKIDLQNGTKTKYPCRGSQLATLKRTAVEKVMKKYKVQSTSSCTKRIGNEIRKLKKYNKERGIPTDCFKGLSPSDPQ